MLTIRFKRVGKINKAQYKIVLQKKTAAPSGRHIEILGSYDPHSKQAILKKERIKYWISKGTQLSDTAYNLFVSKGVIIDKKRPVKIPKKKAEKAPKKGEGKPTENKKNSEDETKEEVKTEAPVAEIKKETKIEAPTAEKKKEMKSEELKVKESKIEEAPLKTDQSVAEKAE